MLDLAVHDPFHQDRHEIANGMAVEASPHLPHQISHQFRRVAAAVVVDQPTGQLPQRFFLAVDGVTHAELLAHSHFQQQRVDRRVEQR
ncbi:hypothetical protein ABZ889_14740 [Nocardia nova]